MKRQISHSGRIHNWDRVIKAKDSTSDRYQSGVHVTAVTGAHADTGGALEITGYRLPTENEVVDGAISEG